MGKGLVGREDGGRLLVPSGDKLKKQVGPLNVHGKIADLVNDKHPVLGQDLEPVRQPVLKMGFFELLNELVTVNVVGREPMLCSYDPQG